MVMPNLIELEETDDELAGGKLTKDGSLQYQVDFDTTVAVLHLGGGETAGVQLPRVLELGGGQQPGLLGLQPGVAQPRQAQLTWTR